MCVCVCVCVCVSVLVAQLCLTLFDHHGLQSARLFCPWNSPGKSTGVCCHSHLQGIFLTQGPNLQADSLPSEHQGSPYVYIWVYIYKLCVYKLNHFAVHRKQTQHCKSTIVQLKKDLWGLPWWPGG